MEEPFYAVARAMRVLMTRLRDWDAVISWMAFHTSAVVVQVATCTKISLEMEESAQLRIY
jgi:hypothetical protein